MNPKLFPLLSTAMLTLSAGCAPAAPAANPGVPVTDVPVTDVRPLADASDVVPKTGDVYMLPAGAGSKDGSSWQNALGAADGIQAGWDKLAPGQTLWLGSGDYGAAKLTIRSGGEAGRLKTLAGRDTGGGAPVFTSDFDKNRPDKTGATFVTLSDGADYWAIQNIAIQSYRIGIASGEGGHVGARVRNFDVTDCREGISLQGGGTAQNPDAASHDIKISGCDFTGYTKRGIRLRNGNYNFQITNCVADAGGKAYATEPFQMGFNVIGGDEAKAGQAAGADDHDITFTGCIAMNSYHDTGKKYWNGDGFVAERGVKNLTFKNCAAFDNTDGGWDTKAENVILENCVALGNKRNYRFWGTTKLINCLSAYSIKPGGSGGDIGLWAAGEVSGERCTFVDNGANFETDKDGKITLTDSIIAQTKARGGNLAADRQGVKLIDCVVWDETKGTGQDPQFVALSPAWDERSEGFNSRKFADKGKGKGFSWAAMRGQLPPFERGHQLTAGSNKDDDAQPKSKPKPAKVAAPAMAKTPAQLAIDAASQPALKNGGFEDDLLNWDKISSAFQTVTGDAAQGQKFLAVNATKRSEAARKIDGLVAGEKYVLKFVTRSNSAADPKDARIILRDLSSKKYLGVGFAETGEQWKEKTLKFTAPGAEVGLELSLRGAGGFEMDDLRVERAG